MAFEFVCPFCHARMRVDNRFAGQTGPCAECGKKVTLPSPTLPLKTSSESRPSSGVASESLQSHKADIGQSTFEVEWYAKSSFLNAFRIALLLLVFGIAGWLLLPSAQRAIQERQKLNTLSNIQQIAKALNAYRIDYDSYPTPTVYAKNGTPLYSWRVLLLPYLGYKDLYARFQLEQPWDSPSNVSLIQEMPSIFVVSGNQTAQGLGESNFALVVGPGTLFETPSSPSGSLSNRDIIDEPSETILVVEVKESGTVWTQPGNIDNSGGTKIGSRPGVDIGGNFDRFVIVATVDGNGLAMSPQTPQTTIQAMLSPDGGEIVEIENAE